MPLNISAKADKSSILYEGRAKISVPEDILAMQNQDWRKRLSSAIEKSERSMRSISLGAKMGAGYVHSILKDGKDPGIDSLIAICDVMNVSLSQILYGIEIGPGDEELLSMIQNSDPEKRMALLRLLKDKTTP